MFSTRIKSLRKKKGWTQEEVAVKLEIARTTYSGYERGTSEPDFIVLKRIAELYEVDLSLLFEGDSKKSNPEVEQMIDDFVSLNEVDQKYILELINRLKKERP